MMVYIPTRSLGPSSLTEESEREKSRFRPVDFGVVVGGATLLVACASGTLTLPEFHRRCLFTGSLFPTAS